MVTTPTAGQTTPDTPTYDTQSVQVVL